MAKKAVRKSGFNKLRMLAIVLAILATAFAVALLVFNSRYVFVRDSIFTFEVCEKAETQLDLTGSGMNEFHGVEHMKHLTMLDLRGSELSEKRFDEISEALPDCTVLWDVPMGGSRIDCMTTSLNLDDSSDFDNLAYFPKLAQINAAGCTRYEDILAINEKLPNVTLTWEVPIEGVSIAQDTESIKLSADATAEDIDRLRYVPGLKYVDAKDCGLYPELMELEKNIVSGCDVEWQVDIAGLKVSSLSTGADLRGYTVSDPAIVEDAIQYLPRLNYLDMCGCGLSNEQMEKLRNDHPEIKFVWTISFARWENIRTDIQVFSSLNYSKQLYDQEDYGPLLKYCTDLVAVDLGHSSITNLSAFTNLKKLECLFLTDNCLTDISGIEQLQELQTIELFSNKIKDFSALNELPHLHDIGIGFNPKEGYTQLTDLKEPENIWLTYHFDGYVPQETKDLLEGLYPDANFCYFAGKWSIASGPGWCGIDRFIGYCAGFQNWTRVIYFNSWDDYELAPKGADNYQAPIEVY